MRLPMPPQSHQLPSLFDALAFFDAASVRDLGFHKRSLSTQTPTRLRFPARNPVLAGLSRDKPALGCGSGDQTLLYLRDLPSRPANGSRRPIFTG
jgi:hypothetical protein